MPLHTSCSMPYTEYMFSFLRSLFSARRAVVVSWDARGVWAVSAKRTGDMLSVDEIVLSPLPDARDASAISRSIKRTLSKLSAPRRVYLPIPSSAAIRFVTVLPRPYGNQDTAIMDHLRAYCQLHDIAFRNGARIAYQVIDPGDTLVVAATIVDRHYVDEAVRRVQIAGYRAYPVLVADEAARLSNSRGGSIILSVGTHETTIIRLVDGAVVETVWHPIGVEHLANTLVRYRSLSEGDAYEAIRTYGLLQAHPDNAALSELYSTLSPIFRTLDRSIRESRLPYQHVRLSAPVNSITLVGPGATLPGLSYAVSNRTGIETHILSPRDLAWGPDTIPQLPPEDIHHIWPHLAVASAVLGAKFHNHR